MHRGFCGVYGSFDIPGVLAFTLPIPSFGGFVQFCVRLGTCFIHMFGVIRRYFVLSHTLGLLLSNEGKNIEIRGRNERNGMEGGFWRWAGQGWR